MGRTNKPALSDRYRHSKHVKNVKTEQREALVILNPTKARSVWRKRIDEEDGGGKAAIEGMNKGGTWGRNV